MHLHLQQLTCICQDIETDLNLYRIGIHWMSFVFLFFETKESYEITVCVGTSSRNLTMS